MRGEHHPSNCPMDAILRLLMGPWTTYVLWILRSGGPIRFGELKREIAGVSAKVLTERLRALEAAGIVYRHYEPTVPPAVTYGLTSRGRELDGVLDALNDVAVRWQSEDRRAPSRAVGPAADLGAG
ncbi:MAG TPA: helix-turn-helix domain-containing protein [Stellaceae bacterium]|jgi:DNA-binding HxlR family transcriptional regulator|nr:helix-turn-helix domain-containing protein [Stellaceae bacterium]